MEQPVIIVKGLFGENLGISPEFIAYLSLKGPHLLWVQNLDFFVCHFEDRRPYADKEKSLNHNSEWTRIDLHEDDQGKVIGFNTLFLGSAKGMLSRMFQMTKEETIHFREFVPMVNKLCMPYGSHLGFHDTFDELLHNKTLGEMSLSVISLETGDLTPLTRELFLSLGGELLV